MLAKSNGNLFAIAFKSEKERQVGRTLTLEREPSKKKRRTVTKIMQRVLKVITLQGAIKKSPILLSQYWKFELYPFILSDNLLFELYHLFLEFHGIRYELRLFMAKAFPLLELIMTSTG